MKFLSAKTNATLTASDGEKLVTVSDYTTINNSGTIVIDSSNFSATGFSYEVNSTARSSFYQDNQFVDSFSSPFNVKIPSSNATSSYKLIGADSIYFQNGGLSSGISGANGGRYTLNGNLLTITQNASKDSTFQDSGVTFHMVETILASVVMEKQ
ncbi:MAG TPA: hypothetical protein VGW31_11825 [Hanamia sp.]|nr:hypothetical protein [Hanamia sp.]